MTEAMLYEKLDGRQVCCKLCAHRCRIAAGKRGICRVRENRNGILYTLVYGRTISSQADPIEKKPLYHFFPGSRAYSIATPGCNFHCRWCQNWEISQVAHARGLGAGRETTPGQVVSAALRGACRSIAYTYTEPTVFFEYSYDTTRLARTSGLANIFVTNGYMSSEALEAIGPYLDAANVDLKAFRDETYRRYVGARLQPVLDSLKKIRQLGIWLEVTTLVIPGINDDRDELSATADFICRELGAETPWHLSRFFPCYRMTDVPPTPLETLQLAERIGFEAGLHHVYIGNVSAASNTLCSRCGRLLIQRSSYRIVANHLDSQGACPGCGFRLAGKGLVGQGK